MKRKETAAGSPSKSKRKSARGGLTPAQQEEASAAGEEDLNLNHEDTEHLPEDDEEGGIRIGDIYIPPPPQGIGTYGSDGPRLMITHIDNENFKSYAGKTTLGPFHKCFTSIVGPNGSGKSNVIDSMLFVFGYRATKIRSKKISVLIHNSDQHHHCQSCSVAVHFQLIIDRPGDDYEVVPNSKFVIARTAFRDNSSYYTIDGKRVQFKEVAALLRSHKVDLDHNRFLILQGEVEQIAMMKPKGQTEHETGMLEFLEDIIGTNRYKEPIEKLNILIDNLNEERIEKLNRAKMVEKEKDALEGPKNEAVKALRIENQFTLVMHKHLQKYLLGARREVQKNEEKKKEVEDGMADMKAKLKEVEDKVKAKEGAVAQITKTMDKMQAQKEKLHEEYKKINNKDNTIQADIEQNNKKRKKLQEQVKEEERKLAELLLIPGKNEKEIEELKVLDPKVTAECELEQKALEKVIKSMGEETKDLTDKKDKLQNELVGLREVLGAHRAKYDVAQKELDIYLQNEKDEQKKFDELTAKYTSNGEKIESNKKALQELKKKVPTAQRELDTAKKELAQVNQEETAVAAQLRAQRGNVEEVKSNQAASRSQNVVLDTLMQRKRDGTLPGVIGRLGDLGGINQKYDVAVSTACPQLDFIVVDTVVSGQACVDYLKKYNVGRANFIALDKQQHLRGKCQQKMDTPENVPRLFDLIDIPDENVRPAFYYVMRDTLVANDLDQASRIGYGRVRHRVVTLGGELIEPAGTMSGGGKTQIRGKMGRQSKSLGASAQEVNAMVKKLEDLERRWGELNARQTELNDKVRTLTQQVQNDSATLRHSEMELEALTKQQPDLEQQLKRQKQRVKEASTDPKHVKSLETKLAKIKEDVDEAAQAESKVSKDVQKVTQEIEKLTSGKMKAQQKKLDDVTTRLDKIRAEITKLNVAIKTSTRNANKTRDKITNMKQEIEDIKANLLEMVKERDNCEDEGKKVLDMLEAVSNGIVEKEAEVKVIRDELGVLLAEEKEIKSSKMDVDQKISALKTHIQDKKKSIQLNTDKIKKLKLHHIPGDETQDAFVELSEEELDKLSSDKIQYEISSLEVLVQKNKPDFAVIEEYNKKDAQFLKRAKELDEVTERRNAMKSHYEMACKRRLDEFTVGFRTITDKLKEMYQMITLGGDAELELVDSFNPFVEGIVFSVRPPKKSWKNISNLSGGEKTLSSLALVFALHYYKPTPLYVMDEIDAALDFKNVSIVGNYIKERTKNAQFIIISLRSNMFELADTLVGIYKTNNCTKTATINPSCYPSKTFICPPPSQSMPPRYCSDQQRLQESESCDVRTSGPMEVSLNADGS